MHRLKIFTATVTALLVCTNAQSLSMKSGGVTRTYVLHVPSGLPANPPLMFILCGHGMTGAQQQSDTKMDIIADREKFITVYPDAISTNWDQTGTTDFVYYVNLLDTLDAKYHVDKKRVYVAGFSQGAGMTHAVGCGYADIFAAIAPVSGNIPATCAPKRPIPMFLTFGTGTTEIATPEKFMASAQTWAKLDGCPTTPTIIRPYPATNAKSVVTRITYAPCTNGTEVIADSIQGGPHQWPMDTTTKVNNSEEVWAFFKRFSLTGTTSIPHRSISAAEKRISATLVNGEILLDGVSDKSAVHVFDHEGREVVTAQLGQRRIVFKNQARGVYQIEVKENGVTRAITMAVP